MSVTVMPPTCTRKVLATSTAQRGVYVRSTSAVEQVLLTGSPTVSALVTSPAPVSVHVTCTPAARRFELSQDGNFVLIPVAGGQTCQVPFLPV